MRLSLKKGQKGFTLVELMVVMGILAVLAAIVVPAVSGTTEVSTDAQVKTDAGMVQSALGDYYGDQVGAEVKTTRTTDILGPTVVDNAAQVISTRWPEFYLTGDATTDGLFIVEFPIVAAIAAADEDPDVKVVEDIIIFDPDSKIQYGGVAPALRTGYTVSTLKAFAEAYNAIDFKKLYKTTAETNYPVAAYIPAVPASNDEKSGSYHNYLWLVKKTDAASGSGGTVESRTVAVFKLAKVVTDETSGDDTLTYEKIY